MLQPFTFGVVQLVLINRFVMVRGGWNEYLSCLALLMVNSDGDLSQKVPVPPVSYFLLQPFSLLFSPLVCVLGWSESYTPRVHAKMFCSCWNIGPHLPFCHQEKNTCIFMCIFIFVFPLIFLCIDTTSKIYFRYFKDTKIESISHASLWKSYYYHCLFKSCMHEGVWIQCTWVLSYYVILF